MTNIKYILANCNNLMMKKGIVIRKPYNKENINDLIIINVMSLFYIDQATTPDSLAWLRITDEDVFSFTLA